MHTNPPPTRAHASIVLITNPAHRHATELNIVNRGCNAGISRAHPKAVCAPGALFVGLLSKQAGHGIVRAPYAISTRSAKKFVPLICWAHALFTCPHVATQRAILFQDPKLSHVLWGVCVNHCNKRAYTQPQCGMFPTPGNEAKLAHPCVVHPLSIYRTAPLHMQENNMALIITSTHPSSQPSVGPLTRQCSTLIQFHTLGST